MLLRAVPQYEFGRGFELHADRECVAQLCELSRGEYEIRVGKELFRISDTSLAGSYFELVDAERRVVATAQRPSPIGPRYELRAGNTTYDLVPPSTFGEKRQVIHENRIVGLIDPDDLGTRTTTVELPDDLGWAECAFLTWIVLRIRS